MYAITQDFLDAMRADRRRVDALVEVSYTDPFIDQSISVAASEQANVSYPQQTTDAVTQTTHKWASLDGSWVLDGSYHLAPAPKDLTRYQFGWWSAQLANPDGTLTSPYPTLTVTHIPRPVHILRVVGDSARGEWPVDFRIDLYGPDDTLLRSEVVTGNTVVEWSMTPPAPVLDVAKQVLTLTRWSHPGRQAKILEFFTSIQETYLSEDIIEIRFLEEREASQGSLPVGNISSNEISLRLANESGKFDPTNPNSPLANLLKPNRRIRAWLGGELTENLCPGFQFWELGGSAEVTPDGVLHLNAYGDYARSPLIRVDGAARWTFSAEYYAEEPGPVFGSNPDGTDASRLLNSSYYAEDGITPATNSAGYTSNGDAEAFPVGVWSESSWSGDGGPDVAFIRIQIQSSSSWTSPRYSVRRPSMTTIDPAIIRKEWVPLGTFWSLDWDSPDDTLEAQVRARDRLELLRKSTYQPGSAQQNVSLYTLAEQVLQDAGLQPREYAIDTALQSIVVPWAWLSPTSHREALRIIAEAALAVVYADRDGVVRIEGLGSVPETPVVEITGDDYFPPLRAPSRQDQVANEIVVATQPLRPADTPQGVYRSTTPITVPAGQTVTVTAKYGQPPVIEAVASLDAPPDVSITAATYYAWGAEVNIQNTGASQADVTLVITGRPLSVQGGERVVVRDDASILENGVLRYEFPANPLVQTLSQAQAIAQALLASAKDPRRDIEVEWRGNPALELGDRVTVVGQDVHVIRQEINWAGALTARLTGRKVT